MARACGSWCNQAVVIGRLLLLFEVFFVHVIALASRVVDKQPSLYYILYKRLHLIFAK